MKCRLRVCRKLEQSWDLPFENLGKPIGSDAENEKATYVTFEGLEQAKKDVERLSGEAIKILDEFEGEHTFLHDLFFYLINRDH